MAGLKIFVSSTCMDLVEERNQVRNLLLNLGHDPVLSDHNDIYYGNTEHTHVSCIKQISNADMVVLLVGSRYGGVAVEEALKEINLEIIQEKINNKISLQNLFTEMKKRSEDSVEENKKNPDSKVIKYGFSITHFEILRAIQESIPIYAFVKDKVWNFNELYSHNREMIENIKFPSIEKHQSKYLFEFIEILKNRNIGNSIFSYSNFLDIEVTLKKQLAEKLKNLMDEQKNLKEEREAQKDHIDRLTDRFDDLKTAILSTLPKGNERDVAKGLLRFRRLLSIILYMSRKINFDNFKMIESIITYQSSFINFLQELFEISEIKEVDLDGEEKDFISIAEALQTSSLNKNSNKVFYLIRDSNFFIINDSNFYEKLIIEWDEFIALSADVKKPIIEALVDEDIFIASSSLRFSRENIYELLEKIKNVDESLRRDIIFDSIMNVKFVANGKKRYA